MKKITYVLLILFVGILVACSPTEEQDFIEVTFNTNSEVTIAKQKVVLGNLIVKPTDPNQEGFSFEYWYSDDVNTEFDFTVAPTTDLTLNALWKTSELATFNSGMAFLHNANNYELMINIRDNEALSNTFFTIDFDGDKSHYKDGSYEAFYDNSGSQSYIFEKEMGVFVKKEITKPKAQFYYDFEFSWFSPNNDKFILKSESYSKLRDFLLLDKRGTTIENLYLTFGEEHLNLVTFDITLDSTKYKIELTFNKIGQIEIELPKVVS